MDPFAGPVRLHQGTKAHIVRPRELADVDCMSKSDSSGTRVAAGMFGSSTQGFGSATQTVENQLTCSISKALTLARWEDLTLSESFVCRIILWAKAAVS